MRRTLIRQGEGPAAAIIRHQAERTKARRQLDKLILEAELNPALNSTRISRATAAGDERKLRGIPAIGRGVQGCIPGTSPHSVR